MQIRVPVDVMILQTLSDGEHANPVRVRYLIEMNHDLREWGRESLWSLDYVTQRMGELRNLGLLERVEPDDSGLYRISDVGRVVLLDWVENGVEEFDLPEAIDAAADVQERTVDADAITPQGETGA